MIAVDMRHCPSDIHGASSAICPHDSGGDSSDIAKMIAVCWGKETGSRV